ncbi:MAG: hypothetical protein AAGI30_05690 [Planctomycetota bacterium]
MLTFDINQTIGFEGLTAQPEDTVLFSFDIPGFGRVAAPDFEITVDQGGFTGTGFEIEFAFSATNDDVTDGGLARIEGSGQSASLFAAGDLIDDFSTAPFSDPPSIGAPTSLLYTQGAGLFGPVTAGIFDESADGDTAFIGFVISAVDDSTGLPVLGSFHFGWIEVIFDDLSDGSSDPLPATEVELTFVTLGIADTPDIGVFAGGGIVPAPGAAVMLAVGGLAATRRRR